LKLLLPNNGGVILMKKKENFTLESTPKEYDGTPMKKRSFMLDKCMGLQGG
jgi:hypothetical protein